MNQNRQNLYEGMYVISATLSDDARHKALDRIQTGITGHGGEIEKIHEQGRRRLAYEIDGHREGYYYIIYFTALRQPFQNFGKNTTSMRILFALSPCAQKK